MNDNEVLTPKEVSRYLRVSVYTLYRWRRRGYGPTSGLVGNKIRYRVEDVQAWLDRQRET